MKKRFLAAMLTACLMVTTGCGAKEGGDEKTAEEAKSSDYTVTMTLVNIGEVPVDLKMVEDKASEYTQKKIGCNVELKPVALSELTNKINLWTSSKEKVDIILVLSSSNMQQLASSGGIVPITEYLNEENAPNMLKLNEGMPILDECTFNGDNYGVGTLSPYVGQCGGFGIRQDIMDAIEFDCDRFVGYDFETMEFLDYEAMDQLFGEIHEKYPDLITFGQDGVLGDTNAQYYFPYENFNVAGASAGVLMNGGKGETKIVNLYETEEYKEYLEWIHKWQEEGYFSADAGTTTDQGNWMNAGRAATGGNSAICTPGQREMVNLATNHKIEMLQVLDPFVKIGSYSSAMHCVSSCSENPEKAVQFLDLLYAEDGELLNLIQRGIEGVHYEVTDDESGKIIRYPDGVDGTTTTFKNPAEFFGDKRQLKMFEPNTGNLYEEWEKFSAHAIENTSDVIGYQFNTEDVQSELGAINNVLSEYLTMLEYGACELDSTLDRFNQALKDAGIEKVIEENQKQLDEWLANNK